MTKEVLLMGIGNRDRADDGVGPRIAELLAEDTPENALFKKHDVFVTKHSGEGGNMMLLWEGVPFVVVIDAMKSGSALGTVSRFEIPRDKLDGGTFHYSSHVFGLAESVELARQLGNLPKKMIIYGIEGDNFSFGDPLTKEVEAAMDGVMQSVRQDFEEYFRK